MPAQVLAYPVISAIAFEGNDVTDESIMRLEMVISEGDSIDISKIETSVQHITDIGLFEWVRYRLDKAPSTGDVTLVIMVKERFYLIPLPTFKVNGDNELEYGVKVRWDNIWGLNHQLKWKILDQGTSNGVSQFSNKIDYIMPRIFLSRYQLGLNHRNNREVDNDPVFGAQLQKNMSTGFDLLKWLNADGISYGLFASGGITYTSRDTSSLVSLLPSEEKSDAIIYSFRLGTDKRHEYPFNEGGVFLQYLISYSNADRSPGSNSPFVKQQLDYISQNSFSLNPPVNFNYQIVIGHSNNDILGDKAFSIGGNTNLRGYDSGEFRGNSLVRGNFEYLSRLYESSLLRKVFFIDTGAVPDQLREIRLTDFKSSAGAGIRWKLRQFVKLDLRLDAAYAFEDNAVHISLGAHSTF